MLIGRERELARVASLLQEGRCVLLRGSRGTGKTALLDAVGKALPQGTAVGGCLATLRWHAYLPLVRALGVPVPQAGTDTVIDFVAGRLGGRLLVLDDLECADDATLSVVASWVRTRPLLASVRDTDPEPDRLLGYLGPTVVVEDLPPLASSAAADLVRAQAPGLDADTVRRIVSVAGGHPLLLIELARRGGFKGPPPANGVEDVCDLLLEDHPASARRALATLGLIGRPVAATVLGDDAGRLVRRGLAQINAGRIRPRHELLAERAAATLDPAARREIHASLAQMLSDPGESARHHAAAGDRTRAGELALVAARRASRPGERAAHLALAAHCVDGPDRGRLVLEAAGALVGAGRPGAALELLEVLHLQEETTPATALVEARARLLVGDSDGALAAAERGATSTTRSDLRAALLLEAARAVLHSGADPSTCAAAARQAADAAGAAGRGVARARAMLGACLLRAGDPAWSATLNHALTLARQEGAWDVEMLAAHDLIAGHVTFGDGASACALAHEMAGRAAELRLEAWRGLFLGAAAWVSLLERGEYQQAEALAREAARSSPPPAAAAQVHATLVLTLADTGRDTDALSVAREALTRPQLPSSARAVLLWSKAEADWLAGRFEQAIDTAQRATLLLSPGHPLRPLTLLSQAWASADLERPPPPVAPGHPLPLAAGASEEHRALVLRKERPDRAAALFDNAATLWEGRQVRAQLRCGWAALDTATSADAEMHLEALRQASATVGFTALLTRIERTRRRMHPPQHETRARTTLSPREREVMALVGDGLTTAQIARTLKVTPATVETFIRNAMTKLGASTRAQAAALSARDTL